MSETVQTLALEAYSYIAPEDSVTLTDATSAQLTRIIRDMNRAAQRIYSHAPACFKTELVRTLLAPESVTATLTNGSTAVTALTGFTGTPNGESVLWPGDIDQNGLYTAASDTLLLAAFAGTTGTTTGTAYHDVIDLTSEGMERALSDGTLYAAGYNPRRIRPASTRSEWISYRDASAYDYPSVYSGHDYPIVYWVETRMISATDRRIWLHLAPAPRKVCRVSFDMLRRAPTYTLSDLGTDGTDPGTTIEMPDEMVHSIFTPIFLYFWAQSPFFANTEARKEIRDGYAMALADLERYSAQANRGGRIIVTTGS